MFDSTTIKLGNCIHCKGRHAERWVRSISSGLVVYALVQILFQKETNSKVETKCLASTQILRSGELLPTLCKQCRTPMLYVLYITLSSETTAH